YTIRCPDRLLSSTRGRECGTLDVWSPHMDGVAALGREGGDVVAGEGVQDATSAARQKRRRRVEGGRQHRHVVRVTPEEEGQLLALALRYRVSVPKLLIDSALAGGAANAAANASVRDELLTELFKAYRVLAGIANNVNQIAR